MSDTSRLSLNRFGPTISIDEILATTVGNGFLEQQPFIGPNPSGAPTIFIDQCGRIGGSAAMTGSVGNDDFGRMNTDRLARDGVDVSTISIDETLPTGTAFVRDRQDGERDFVFNMWTSAPGKLSWTPDVDAVIALADLLLPSGDELYLAASLDPDTGEDAMREAGDADFLINCAGNNVLEIVLDLTEDGYESVLGINLRAALICAQEFARARVAVGGGGAIVNVTSIAGHRGFPEHLCCAASKAGLKAATRVMAKDLGTHGIRVNAITPTVTMTELAVAAWSDPAKSGPMMVRHPLEKFAEVEDVASGIAMLLSHNAGMITGAVLPLDGGFLSV